MKLQVTVEHSHASLRRQTRGQVRSCASESYIVVQATKKESQIAQKARSSIWLLIGVLPVIFGAMILGSDLVKWATVSYPAGVQLTQLHAPVWWGATLLALGIFYVVKFPPRRAQK